MNFLRPIKAPPSFGGGGSSALPFFRPVRYADPYFLDRAMNALFLRNRSTPSFFFIPSRPSGLQTPSKFS